MSGRVRIQFQTGRSEVVPSENIDGDVSAKAALKALEKLHEKAAKKHGDKEWQQKLNSTVEAAKKFVINASQGGGFTTRERVGSATVKKCTFKYGPGQPEYRIEIECRGDKEVTFFGK